MGSRLSSPMHLGLHYIVFVTFLWIMEYMYVFIYLWMYMCVYLKCYETDN
jgi:hypothetical protein